MKVVYTDRGLAACYNDGNEKWIEINKKLRQDKYLHDVILEHETFHLNSDNPIDFWFELKDGFNIKKQIHMIKFFLKNPSCFFEGISPIELRDKKVFFNYYAIIIPLILISIVVIVAKILK